MTQIIKINPQKPDPKAIELAANVLRSGGLVAYPTETTYGLAASAFVVDTVANVYDALQRPFTDGLPVQIAERSDIETLARNVPRRAWPVIDRFFPGPLTLFFFRLPTVSLTVTGGQNMIKIEMPSHPIASSVIRAFGAPVVCPVASLTGRRLPLSAADVQEDLDGAIDLILDGGETPGRTPRTVLDFTVEPPRILSEGKITREELQAVLALTP